MGPVVAPIVGIALIILIAGIVGLAVVGIAYYLFKLSTSTADAEPFEPEVNADGPLKESYSLFGEALGVKPYPLAEVQQLEEKSIVLEKVVSPELGENITQSGLYSNTL